MVERADSQNIRLVVDHMHRYTGGYETVKKWKNEFDLGDPVQFVSTGGAVGLVNNGIHLLDLAVGLFHDMPNEGISAAQSQQINPEKLIQSPWKQLMRNINLVSISKL